MKWLKVNAGRDTTISHAANDIYAVGVGWEEGNHEMIRAPYTRGGRNTAQVRNCGEQGSISVDQCPTLSLETAEASKLRAGECREQVRQVGFEAWANKVV